MTNTHEQRATMTEIPHSPHGSHGRFMQLLEPVSAQLLRYVYSLTRNADEAKDITNETIVVALEQLSTLKTEQAFKSWMFCIARRLFLQQVQRKKRYVDVKNLPDTRTESCSPEISMETHLLYQAMEKLPPDQREAITLFDITGLSLEEVRQIQGGSLSGVKSRLVRGRKKLSELLGVINDMH